jgi:hypothetical protein
MFTLIPQEVARFDLGRAAEFVAFWSRFYVYRVKVLGEDFDIDYLAELNIGADLNDDNVRRLLRWKDPHHLTDPILSGPSKGQPNDRVVRVLAALGAINGFRQGIVSASAMREIVAGLFPSGFVFQVFIMHIARPHMYPIADQHVFRAYGIHRGVEPYATWDTYLEYTQYFAEIARSLEIDRSPENTAPLKRIDNALMVFGQFLKSYYRDADPIIAADAPNSDVVLG